MACLLLALILAATVLSVPTGNHKLANAARTTSPAEAFWRTALPGAPMPEAIRELLHPHAADKATHRNDASKLKDDGDDPPPMNFNYDDYRAASHRNENTAPSAEVLKHAPASAQNAATNGDGTMLPAVFFLEDAVRVVPFRSVPRADTTDAPAAGLDPPRLYTIRAVRAALEAGGSSFVVCSRGAGGPDDDAVTYVCRAKTSGPARAYAATGARGNDESPVSP